MILKITMISIFIARSEHLKIDKNKLNKDASDIRNSKINVKIANLSSNPKKISFKAVFFTFKTSLAFI